MLFTLALRLLYDWDILGSSIYIVDILRIDDLRIDDQTSILRSSIYRVFKMRVFALKSGLRILIRAPEVPFSVPPK